MSVAIRLARRAGYTGFAALLFVGAFANANALYKCGEPGKTIYRDTACAGGELMVPPLPPAPTDVAAAERRAFRERAELGRLQAKLAGATMPLAQASGNRVRHVSASNPACATLLLKSKWRESYPGSMRRSVRARPVDEQTTRQFAEQYALLCAPSRQMVYASGAPQSEFISAFPTTPRRAARLSQNTLSSGE
jgi:hypothetical protein